MVDIDGPGVVPGKADVESPGVFEGLTTGKEGIKSKAASSADGLG